MGHLDKFAALAEALDVDDDTQAIERPEPTVRSALQAGRPVTATPPEAPDAPTKPSPATPPAVHRPQRTSPERTARAAARSTDTKSTAPRMRSSVNIPVSVWERVRAAKDDRWELSEILARSLQRPAATAEMADRRHRSMRDELRVQRQYRVTEHARDLLDRLATEWRMSRSEVVAVLLDAELDTMERGS